MNTPHIEITPEYLASQGLSLSFPARFWAKVNKTETCWLWTGCINDDGYGMIGRGGSEPNLISAHRASWLLHFGPIQKGLVVRHRCEPIPQPACIRPAHLWLGTKAQNTRDAVELLHQQYAAHWNSRLSKEQIEEIRYLATKGHSNVDLGKHFGVSPHHISKIKHRKCWLHIIPEPLDGSGWEI